jgi:hypothetical protein
MMRASLLADNIQNKNVLKSAILKYRGLAVIMKQLYI